MFTEKLRFAASQHILAKFLYDFSFFFVPTIHLFQKKLSYRLHILKIYQLP